MQKPEIPLWLDNYIIELTERSTNPNLSQIERTIAAITLSGIQRAHLKAMVVHSQTQLNLVQDALDGFTHQT